MTRESDVVRSLVELADALVSDYDVVDMLTGLADRCVHVLGVTAAGVMLASPSGELRLVASSSEAMRVLELFELQAREGPCLDAFRTGETVEHESLRVGTGRWPLFASVAVAAGFRSAMALPLRLRDTTIGALNLVRAEPASIDDADVLVARAFADLATISVVQQRATGRVTTPQRATRHRAEQPNHRRTGEGRDLRTRRHRSRRSIRPPPRVRTRPQRLARRRGASRNRRHPRPPGLGTDPRPTSGRYVRAKRPEPRLTKSARLVRR